MDIGGEVQLGSVDTREKVQLGLVDIREKGQLVSQMKEL